MGLNELRVFKGLGRGYKLEFFLGGNTPLPRTSLGSFIKQVRNGHKNILTLSQGLNLKMNTLNHPET